MMKKISKIETIENFVIRCEFNNGEIRDLDLRSVLDKNGKYSRKVFDEKVFKSVKVGEIGQLYWNGIAEMKLENGETIPVEYDICPDLAYIRSSSVVPNSLK